MALTKIVQAANNSGTPSELQSALVGVPEIEQTGNRGIFFLMVFIRFYTRYTLNRFDFFDFSIVFYNLYVYIYRK